MYRPENPFDACWNRIDRLSDHQDSLASIWNDYLSQEPFGTFLEDEGNGHFLLNAVQEIPLPVEFSIIFGEWLYNARACLDYIIWAAAACACGQIPPPNEGDLGYPIFDSESLWQKWMKKHPMLPDHQIELLSIMQPFNNNMDANFLRVINRLSRVDRHRRLTIGTAVLSKVDPIIEAPESSEVSFQWGNRIFKGGVVQLAKIHIKTTNPDFRPRVNPRLIIDPEIEEWQESNFWKNVPFGDRLEKIQLFVAGEVATYEYDCLGASRKANFLTPEFKALSDARGHANRPKVGEHLEVDWGPSNLAQRTEPTEFFQEDD